MRSRRGGGVYRGRSRKTCRELHDNPAELNDSTRRPQQQVFFFFLFEIPKVSRRVFAPFSHPLRPDPFYNPPPSLPRNWSSPVTWFERVAFSPSFLPVQRRESVVTIATTMILMMAMIATIPPTALKKKRERRIVRVRTEKTRTKLLWTRQATKASSTHHHHHPLLLLLLPSRVPYLCRQFNNSTSSTSNNTSGRVR